MEKKQEERTERPLSTRQAVMQRNDTLRESLARARATTQVKAARQMMKPPDPTPEESGA